MSQPVQIPFWPDELPDVSVGYPSTLLRCQMPLRDQMTVGIGYAQAFTVRSNWELCLQVHWGIGAQFLSTPISCTTPCIACLLQVLVCYIK